MDIAVFHVTPEPAIVKAENIQDCYDLLTGWLRGERSEIEVWKQIEHREGPDTFLNALRAKYEGQDGLYGVVFINNGNQVGDPPRRVRIGENGPELGPFENDMKEGR